MKKHRFTAELKQYREMDATFVEIPLNVEDVFGTRGRVKVKATIDGASYRGSIANMGGGCHILGVTQAIRKAIGKSIGQKVDITLEQDTEERVIELPDELRRLFQKNPKAATFFETLSYTNRKEYVQWIVSAKKPETRAVRVNSTIEKLSEGLKNPSQK
jgi:hypothetical protein